MAKTSEVTTPNCPPPAKRPEQLWLLVRVAVHASSAGEGHLCADQRIAGQPVPATEQAEPAAHGESGDADRRAAAGWDGPPALVQCVVHLGQPRAPPRSSPIRRR